MNSDRRNDIYTFLTALAANNNRDWFNAHKPEYQELRELWLNDVQRLIDLMAQWDPRLTGLTASRCAYRIYRDTRFSKDKTPYKTYFSAAISPTGRSTDGACFYLQTGVSDYNGLFAGIWCPEPAVLKKLRHAIVDNIEEWEEITSNPEMRRYFNIFCSSQLKTIPKGWPKDHPQARWLRMKDYGLDAELGRDFFTDPHWPEKASELCRLAAPFNDFLNYSIDEDIPDDSASLLKI